MSDERLKQLARQWGLVGLGAIALCMVRLMCTLLDDWLQLRLRTDWRTLAARMSQLKPPLLKAPWVGIYAGMLVAVLALIVVVWLALVVVDLRKSDPEE